MLLFIFVFFLPLFIIIYCYVFIFRAIRATNQSVSMCSYLCVCTCMYQHIYNLLCVCERAVGKVNGSVHSHSRRHDSVKNIQRLQNEWKMAKIALIVILLYVISWSPYSCVALTAFAG